LGPILFPLGSVSGARQIPRPREKLRERGACALTDEEHVVAILGMGMAEEQGLGLA